ncbi:MAG: gamma carbonic anhydrase family protein [Gammaproteobacteria bacterium]|nr:gamma carbonic anhydrase family protein [Gammaproteobacteria bacterium]
MLIKVVGNQPKLLSENCFIADTARVMGRVIIGGGVTVWYGAVVRGDDDQITIGDDTNVQDNAVLHVDIDKPLIIGKGVTIGHAAVLHGCTIGDDCLIGMNAVVLDDAVIGDGSIVGAHALIPPGKKIPPRSLVVGSPGKIVREVSDEDLSRIQWNAGHYKSKIDSYKNIEIV